MGLLEFNKLPINTLVGADWKTFKAIAGKAIQETVGRQAFGTRSGLYPRTLA